jgi:hypothetical protein
LQGGDITGSLVVMPHRWTRLGHAAFYFSFEGNVGSPIVSTDRAMSIYPPDVAAAARPKRSTVPLTNVFMVLGPSTDAFISALSGLGRGWPEGCRLLFGVRWPAFPQGWEEFPGHRDG